MCVTNCMMINSDEFQMSKVEDEGEKSVIYDDESAG